MITIENFDDVVNNKHQEDQEAWIQEVWYPTFDPISKYGTEVKVLRGEFPLHKSISWDWIVPVIDKEINDGTGRILDPNFETKSQHNVEKIKFPDGTESPWLLVEPEQDSWLYTVVGHSTKFYNEELKKRYIEARNKYGLTQCHIYTTYSTKSTWFGMHDDQMSSIIVAGIGDVEYSFKDGSSYILKPGDGIYIPRGVSHKPNIFGPRATFSYSWSYVK